MPSSENGGRPIVGFFTSRNVTAPDKEAAIHLASGLIEAEWKSGDYAKANSGKLPEIVAEEIERIGVLSKLLERTPGYTFYTEEPSDEDDPPAA